MSPNGKSWIGALGLEPTPELFLQHTVEVFREVKRVLRDDGTCWLNMGDSYVSGQGGRQSAVGESPKSPIRVRPDPKERTDVDVLGWSERAVAPRNSLPASTGLKPKDLCGIPWRLALALQADGWYLRSDIIWHKPNPMPESCTDRPTKAHEYLFLLTKRPTYHYDAEAVREKHADYARGAYGITVGTKDERPQPGVRTGTMNSIDRGGAKRAYNPGGRNLRTVWTIPTQAFAQAHFATFPEKLVEPCIKAGTSEEGCCPECGAGWRRVVERTAEYKAVLDRGKAWRTSDGKPDSLVNRQEKGHVSQVPTKNKTIGWEPGCECLSDDVAMLSGDPDNGTPVPFSPVPCTVLDLFCGSGTVGVVCRRWGRSFIGIELNAEYAAMARKRIAGDGPTLWEVSNEQAT
jgi:DNA modification methylase